MKIKDQIGLLALIIAILFFLFFKLKMNNDYKVAKEIWKSKDLHGIVIDTIFHNEKTNEKPTFSVIIRTGKQTQEINEYFDDNEFKLIVGINDSLSKKSGTYEIDIYRSDTLYKRCFPYKDEK